MAVANVKPEMKGDTSRWTTREDAKRSSKKVRRNVDKAATEEGCRDREAGIIAIIALQAFVGKEETREQAEKGWAAMSDEERAQTMLAYNAVCRK